MDSEAIASLGTEEKVNNLREFNKMKINVGELERKHRTVIK